MSLKHTLAKLLNLSKKVLFLEGPIFEFEPKTEIVTQEFFFTELCRLVLFSVGTELVDFLKWSNVVMRHRNLVEAHLFNFPQSRLTYLFFDCQSLNLYLS